MQTKGEIEGMKPQELSINGELFEETRNNLDAAMIILVNRMISTRINKGTVSLKIGIEIKDIINDDGEVIRMPEISYNIGMGMTEKDSLKGNLQRGLMLKRSSCGKLFVSTEQISMDELMEGQT